MISDAQLTPDWRNGFGWKRRGGGAVAPLSARQLAASLWRLGGGSVRGLSFDRLGLQFCSSLPIPKFATKCDSKAWDCADYLESNVKLTSSGELFESRKHVNEEREAEGGWSRIRYGMMNEERKICKNMDKMNSKMVRDIGEAKLSARKLKWNLEKEKKARKELEGVCYDLANEIKGRKAEIRALRKEQRRIREEVEEERRMREVSEVWREERAQMKLADANLILEDKYAEINEAMAHLRAFHADVGVKDLKALAVIKDSKKWCSESESKRKNIEAVGRCKSNTIRNPHVVRGMKGDIHEWPSLRLTKC